MNETVGTKVFSEGATGTTRIVREMLKFGYITILYEDRVDHLLLQSRWYIIRTIFNSGKYSLEVSASQSGLWPSVLLPRGWSVVLLLQVNRKEFQMLRWDTLDESAKGLG